MARQNLHVVGASETAPSAPKKPPTITSAVEDNDRRATLLAIRRRIAQALDDPKTAPRDLAALSRRLQEIGKELEELPAEEEHGRQGTTDEDEPFDPTAV